MSDELLRADQLLHATAADALLTVKEYAEWKRVTTRTVERWIQQRLLDAERTAGPRGHWRIKVKKAA